MKTRTVFWAALAFCLVASGCTMQTMVPHSKGKVIISSAKAGVRHLDAKQSASRAAGHSTQIKGLQVRGVKPSPVTLKAAHRAASDRSAHIKRGVRGRDLSVYDDVEELRYKVVNLDPSSGEADIEDWIDPWWPYVDLYLTPGQTYQITLTVITWPDSPAAAAAADLGITGFGDQAVFTVDDYWDTYVDLYVHATEAPLYDPTKVADGTVAGLRYIPGSGPQPAHLFTSSAPTPSVSGADQFVYGPDNRLYYFNKDSGKIFQWTNVGVPATAPFFDPASDPVYDFEGNPVLSFEVDAIAVDPYYYDTIWILGTDLTHSTWGIYYVDTSTSGEADEVELGTFSGFKFDYWMGENWEGDHVFSFSTVHPTGIAVDLEGNTFVTFSAQEGSEINGGVLALDWWWDVYTWDPNQLEPGNSYYSDVAVIGGQVYVASSPIFASGFGSVTQNTGLAGIFVYDSNLSLLDSKTSTYSSAIPSHPGGSSLWGPSRFQGLGSDGQLYFTQGAWTPPGWSAAATFSRLSNNLNSVSDAN